MTEKTPYWGMEAICDIRGCQRANDPEWIADFARELVHRLDMDPHGEPQLHHFGVGEKAGWTLVQLITTSNIIGHFNDVDGSCYLNVFSCKAFTADIVEACIEDYFKPEQVYTEFLIRNAHRL